MKDLQYVTFMNSWSSLFPQPKIYPIFEASTFFSKLLTTLFDE